MMLHAVLAPGGVWCGVGDRAEVGRFFFKPQLKHDENEMKDFAGESSTHDTVSNQ